MIPSKLRTAAAKFSLGLATTEELIDAAHDALNRELHCHCLGELATQYESDDYEARRLFVDAMGELGILLDSATSVRWLMFSVSHGIVEGSMSTGVAYEEFERYERYIGDEELAGVDEQTKLYCLGWRKWFSGFARNRELAEFAQFESYTTGESLTTEECSELIERSASNYCRRRFLPHLQPAYLTPTVLGLISAVREDHAFDRLPILADALQEAGCEHEVILTHLREQNPHERCCWVAELLADVR
jgi:hypothetical protein